MLILGVEEEKEQEEKERKTINTKRRMKWAP